ncbi:MmcQ/YjbR family DNA-binding protein [Brevundimonas sp.]|uniref:MmcQ/YjbR family DNA-binding protein n=1 Tax=Brevundimonas sp. TaxID=1871086 RepID=UPI001DECAE01|nr:MmcQ/YjbR family DNA-binding protein [Brevundimonas sp.]MBL0948392.1 MmcQ/YjbR family DNA-binding protein [Brevundimonas sp.]
MDRAGIGRVCLALPATTLAHSFGEDHDVYKVGGKMFAIVGGEGALSFKVSDIAYEVLTEAGHAAPAPYMARRLSCDGDRQRVAHPATRSGRTVRETVGALKGIGNFGAGFIVEGVDSAVLLPRWGEGKRKRFITGQRGACEGGA